MKRSSKGFTLIELLIAMAMALIIGTAMAALFAKTVSTRGKVEADGQRIETGRYALDALADDLRLAGFYGDFQPRSSSGAWPPDSLPDNTWTMPDPCNVTLASHWANASATSASVPVAIQGYDNPGASAVFDCLDNRILGTDVIVVRRVSSVAYPTATAATAPVAPYLQASNCNTVSVDGGLKFAVDLKTSASALPAGLDLHELNCTTQSRIRRYMVRVYYIADCNICTPTKDNIPTLSVVEFEVTGGALAMSDPRQVAPGIENIHVEYGVDGAGNGSPDGYQLSTADGIPAFLWQNVMAVKVYLLARDLSETKDYTNAKEYDLGQEPVGAKNDSYKRGVFSETIRLVNPSGARES